MAESLLYSLLTLSFGARWQAGCWAGQWFRCSEEAYLSDWCTCSGAMIRELIILYFVTWLYKCNYYVIVNAAAVDSHYFASWLSGSFLSFHLLTTAKNTSLKHCQLLRLVASFYDSNIPGNRVDAGNVSEADRMSSAAPTGLSEFCCVLCVAVHLAHMYLCQCMGSVLSSRHILEIFL